MTKNLVTIISKLFPDAIFYKPTSAKILSLTIDDVGGDDTREILQVIDHFNQDISNEQEQIRATFFIITDKITDCQILEEIIAKGHEIGNHGNLDHFHRFLPTEQFAAEIHHAHGVLPSRGAEVKWFRPGRALYNCSMLRTLGEMTGYCDRFALASMLPLDTFPITNQPSFTLNYLSHFIFPGSILLLHGGDQERTTNTVEVLTTLLPQLRQQEYRVVALSQLWEDDN